MMKTRKIFCHFPPLIHIVILVAFLLVPITQSAASVSAPNNPAGIGPEVGQTDPTREKVDPDVRGRVSQNLMNLPISFIPNHGQTDPGVRFTARGRGYGLFILPEEIVLAATPPLPDKSVETRKGNRPDEAMGPDGSARESAGRESKQGDVLRMQFIGAAPSVSMKGVDELPGKINYFIGNDPAKWRTGIPTFARVKFENLYPGVALVFYGREGLMEYDMIVAPGVDPGIIRLRYSGADKLALDKSGNLVVSLAHGDFLQHRPRIYQDIDGKRQPVDGGYVLSAKNEVGFTISSYDRRRPLIIDPVLELTYSTYLGGGSYDRGHAVALDSSGCVYVTGSTDSSDFPLANAFGTYSGNYEAFVSKFSADGSSLVYSTYLGGNEYDMGDGVLLDSLGCAYVVGSTSSSDYPVANAFQGTSGGHFDVFVTKLSSDGSSLVYSTYLGGSRWEEGHGIAVDSSGCAYVTGFTLSSGFPVENAYQGTRPGGYDAFVTKFSADGSNLEYSTFLGGLKSEHGYGIAVDSSGCAYVTGFTHSSSFPVENAYQATIGGGSDAFVTKFSADGSSLEFSTFLGGSDNDSGEGIAVNSLGYFFILGDSSSPNFPVKMPIRILTTAVRTYS